MWKVRGQGNEILLLDVGLGKWAINWARVDGRRTSLSGWAESGVLLGQVRFQKLISHPSGDVKQAAGDESGTHAGCRNNQGELFMERSSKQGDGVTRVLSLASPRSQLSRA